MRGKANKRLTDEEIDFIRENYKGTSHEAMAKLLTERSGTPRSEAQVSGIYKKYGLNSGLTGHFLKGHPSMNKGVPMVNWMNPESIEKIRKTQFKKGHPFGGNHIEPLPVGTRRVRCGGYVWVKIAMPNKWKEEHKIVWEKAHGPLKRYQKLLHIDGNPSNNSLENLMLIANDEMVEINDRLHGLTKDAEINKAIIMTARLNRKVADRKKKGR